MRLFAKFLKKVVSFYQLWLSPWFGSRCRFHPSCSEYTKQALSKYSWTKALLLGAKRILKCHPFHSGGIDFP